MHRFLRPQGDGQNAPAGWTPAAWAATLAGATLLALAALELTGLEWGAVGIMSALGLATGVFAFPIGRKHFASMSAAVYIGSAALFGGFVAVWVVGASSVLLQAVAVRRGVRAAAVTVASDVLGIFAAALAYVTVGGRVPPPPLDYAQAGRFVVMFAAFSLTSALISGSALDGLRHAFFRYVRWLRGSGVVLEAALLPLAMLLVASYTPDEPATFPLLVVVLIVTSAAGKLLWDATQGLSGRVEELRVLNTLGRELSSALKLGVLVEILHARVRELVPADVVVLALYNEGDLDMWAALGEPDEPNHSATWRCSLDGSLIGRLVRHREPILVQDLDEQASEATLNEQLGEEIRRRSLHPRSWLGVPLLSGDRFVGVLAVLSETPGAFQEAHVALFSNLGNQLGRAAENARLYENLERSEEAIGAWNAELEGKVRARTAEVESARKELETLNGDLEQRVMDRTAEVERMQERAVQSARMAAAGELASGLAHELNNPLGSILGYAQYDLERLERGAMNGLSPEDGEKLKSHLSYIERESQRCCVIVENLLKFAQSNPTMLARTSINGVLRETLAVTEKQMSMRGIEVELKLDEGVPEVLGDPTQLKQVFANLILNARHGMPSGGRLRVETSRDRTGDDGEGVLIAFEDSGCGIGEEHLGRIFEPFYTVGDVGHGMGLGLSVSHGIVAEHGGDIDVASRSGVGTTFTVRLPAAGHEAPAVPPPESGEWT
jgi:signal transduction histidine kinase